MKSYSLNKLDILMLEFIGSIKNGFYIECGANDGISQSNTKIYEEALGWTGLLVEPNKTKFEACKLNRPHSIIENYALVSNKWKKNTIKGYFNFPDYHNSLCAQTYEDNNFLKENNGKYLTKITNSNDLTEVPAIQLHKLLTKHNIKGNDVHFFSLDVEGYELQVLNGLNLEINKPLFILLECWEDQRQEIFDYMLKNNYKLIKNLHGHDFLFQRDKI